MSSPVFAGFLFLAGSLSTGGGCERTGVRLLEIIFIQKSIRVHQILQRDGKQRASDQHSIIDCGCTSTPTSSQLTKSSSFMSLADSIHIFTVLGSRAGFSADMTDVTRCEQHPNQKIQQLLYNVFNISFVKWLCIKGKCCIFAVVCVMGDNAPGNKKKNEFVQTWLWHLASKWKFNLTGWSHLKVWFEGRHTDST